MNKRSIVLYSYWALFVVLPAFVFGYYGFHWFKAMTGIYTIFMFFVLAILGKIGFRVWRQVWNV